MKKNFEDMSTSKVIGVIVGVLIAIPLVLALEGWIIMMCWNAAIPALFGLPNITFTQSLWMWMLSTALFGHSYGSNE